MAGIPLTLGFLAKESAYDAFAHGQIAVGGLGADRTGGRVVDHGRVHRALRRRWRSSRPRTRHASARRGHARARRRAGAFLAPAAVLAAAGVVFGIVPALDRPARRRCRPRASSPGPTRLPSCSGTACRPRARPLGRDVVVRRAARVAHATRSAHAARTGSRITSAESVYLGALRRREPRRPTASPASSRAAPCRCTSG